MNIPFDIIEEGKSFSDPEALRNVVEDESEEEEEEEVEGEGDDEESGGKGPSEDRPVLTGEDLIINAPLSTKPIIRNCICNIQCGVALDCLEIAMRLKNAEYNPKKFPAVSFKLTVPKTTNLIFPVGRIVSVGSKSEEDGRLALRKVVRILQKIGYKDAKFKSENFTIQNIMAKTNIGFPIRLEGLAYAHINYCRFEPEIFPGLVYRMKVPPICLLVYVSGRIVFTGAKDRDDVYRAYENIYNVLLAFKQKRRQPQQQQQGVERNQIVPNPDGNQNAAADDDDDDEFELPPVPDEVVGDDDDDEEEEDEDDDDEDELDDEDEHDEMGLFD